MSPRCHVLPYEVYCAKVAAEISSLVSVVAHADPQTPVPTCGDWVLSDLVAHCGHIHRWAAAIVGKLSARRLSQRNADWPLPDDPAAYPAWLATGGRDLVVALRAADPEAPAWVWGDDPHVRFWARRMLHETTVHRYDAESARGRRFELDPDVAVDGVDEFLINLPYAVTFAPGVAILRGLGERLRLSCLDRDLVWLVTLDADGPQWTHSPDGPAPVATVYADAVDMYLWVWGRLDLDHPRIAVSGERAILEHWVRHSAL